MSTMDIISIYGGNPANFLDVGGSADGDQMTEAIKILNNDNDLIIYYYWIEIEKECKNKI